MIQQYLQLATDGKIESIKVTAGSGYTNGTYYAAVYGDGTSAGTSSGAIIRITVSSNQYNHLD